MNNVMQTQPAQEPKAASSHRRAFTLIELLVVIAIISILAGLLLSTLGRAKDRAIRIHCLSNMKQFTLGLLIYAHENQDQLPIAIGDNEPYDLPEFLTPLLLNSGVTRDIMYDPGFSEFNNDNNWNDVQNQVRDIGYVLTFPGPGSWLSITNQNPTIAVPDPSSRVLLGGLVLSDIGQNQTDPASRASYNYTQIAVDAVPSMLRAPHMKGLMPAGDNEGMMDGSATWRYFADMMPRNGATIPVYVGDEGQTNQLPTGNPVCWW